MRSLNLRRRSMQKILQNCRHRERPEVTMQITTPIVIVA
jgi:hypothetical protein